MQRSIGQWLACGMVMLAGCATDSQSVPPSRQLWTPQGDPVTCITTSQIRSTHVVDDQTIHFVMTGRNRMFRNELPARCSGLAFNRSFRHNSRSGQLCSMNTITVVDSSNRQGAVCALGRFQPMVQVTPPPAPPPAP